MCRRYLLICARPHPKILQRRIRRYLLGFQSRSPDSAAASLLSPIEVCGKDFQGIRNTLSCASAANLQQRLPFYNVSPVVGPENVRPRPITPQSLEPDIPAIDPRTLILGRPTKEDIVKQDPGAEAQTLLSRVCQPQARKRKQNKPKNPKRIGPLRSPLPRPSNTSAARATAVAVLPGEGHNVRNCRSGDSSSDREVFPDSNAEVTGHL